MARRILNRKDLRADFEAAERRKQDEDEVEGEEEEVDDDDEEEASDESEGEEAEEEVEEEAPKKKKKAAPKEPKPKRTRTPKQVRMRVVWGVFNNSNQRVSTYDYNKKKEAEEHAAKLMTDKKTTFFIQPIKEPMEDKKE
jgi:DNA (cytosine-5)-methyltransferase 1